MNQTEWMETKIFMLPFDGGASQIHLLSIPKDHMGYVLETIETKVSSSTLGVISSEVIENSIALADLIKDDTMVLKLSQGQSTISTKMFDLADVTFDIWADEKLNTFDLEVWFWADQLFSCEDAENLERFNTLLSILSNISKEKPYKCILTPSEASDPLEDLSKGYGIELVLKNA